MEKKSLKITEAEWPIMQFLWKKETATAAEIVKEVTSKQDRSMRTIKTLLRRLVQKQAVAFTIDEKDARVYHYYACVKEKEAQQQKNESLLRVVYENNSASLLAQFIGNSKLSNAEIEKLETILQQKREENRNG